MDADDVIDCNMYAILMREIVSSDLDIVACSFDTFTEQFHEVTQYEYETIYLDGNVSIIRSMTAADKSKSIRGYIWNKVYSRNIIEGIFFPEEIVMCEDLLFSVNVMLKAKKAALVPLTLYHYRIYEYSSTRRANAAKLMDGVHIYRQIIEIAKNFDDEILNSYKSELCTWCIMVCDKIYSKEEKKYYAEVRQLLRNFAPDRDSVNWKTGKWISVWCAQHNLMIYKIWCKIVDLKSNIRKIGIR